ncbi:MAG TPA: hypothetical protein DEA08_19235, partial [Planctomycetes bacterium]|nr:hypothetical protein [Planctomycetota bacterium]
LRTPLNAMIGYTSLSLSTLRPRLEPKEIGQLERAETAARTLLSLLNSVLDFSKIEA